MKKIKLKLDSIKEMLSKEDMKKVSGGYGECCVCYPPVGTGSPIYERLAPPFNSCQELCAGKYNRTGQIATGGC